MVIKLVHSFWLEFERFFAEEIELENQNPESAESWHDEDEEARPSSPLELNAIPWGKYDDGGEFFFTAEVKTTPEKSRTNASPLNHFKPRSIFPKAADLDDIDI